MRKRSFETGIPERQARQTSVVVKGKCQGLLFSDYVSVAPRRSRYNGTLQSQAAIKHRSDPAAVDHLMASTELL